MNLFNCYQAVGFYTMLPLAIHWLFENGHNTWGYVGAGICAIGYILLSIAVHEAQ